MRIIQNVFQQDFSTLTSSQWLQVVATCYPVLEVTESSVLLREDDLIRLATYLRVQHIAADSPFRLAYCPAAHHVAYKLKGVSRYADWSLTQAAALPASEQQEIIELYRSALESIRSGDAIANNICLAFAFHKPSRQEATELPATSPSPSLGVPANPRRNRAVEELPVQWDHLQAWFRRSNIPARPWNLSELAKQLHLTHSVIRALLMAPKGTPGYSRTAFSKTRLQLLQRYFAPYGYLPL